MSLTLDRQRRLIPYPDCQPFGLNAPMLHERGAVGPLGNDGRQVPSTEPKNCSVAFQWRSAALSS